MAQTEGTTTMQLDVDGLGPGAGVRGSAASRRIRAAIVSIGCAMALSALSARSGAAASGAAADARDRGVLVAALASSLSDVGTSASLVAAGEVDAVLFAESSISLGAEAFLAVARRQPQLVLVDGGVRAVSSTVEEELRRLSLGLRIERLSGTDRVHTAALAADRVLAGSAPAALIIANGWSLSDVGAAVFVAAALPHSTVMYAEDGDALGDVAVRAIVGRRLERIVLVGDERSLSSGLHSGLRTAADWSDDVDLECEFLCEGSRPPAVGCQQCVGAVDDRGRNDEGVGELH